MTRALEAADIKVVPTGLKHGTVTAIVAGRPFELTTLRRDVETDGRRAVVAFTDDWRTDAERRDFTFNALYADPDGTIHDYFDGRADLVAGRVRFIGDPDRRIAEDRLRVLRFFRFHAWFGQPPLDGPGFDACRRNAATLGGLSGERVAKELLRLLAAPAPADALEAMVEAGALDRWLPEYAGTARLRALISREDKPDPLRRLAAILSPDADATAIGKRLKLSTQQSVRLQMMLDPALPDGKDFRVSLYRMGATQFVDRLLLEGDAAGDWRRGLALARDWTAAGIPARRRRRAEARHQGRPQGGRASGRGRALVGRGWFRRRSRGLPGRARASRPRRMIRAGLTFALWLAIAVFVVLNDRVGDHWLGATLPVLTVEWYKVLVPLPYVAMLAIIHARRTAGPRWLEAALLAALLWPASTVLAEFLYARLVYDDDPAAFFNRFTFWWGAPYPLLVLFLLAAPLAAGFVLALHGKALRPAHLGRQRHQDRLDIAAGHQAELGAAVVQQVELDIAAAAHELVLALGGRPRLVHVRGAPARDRPRGRPRRRRG